MRILQVISYFAPKRGGDVNICYNLSKELNKLGHDVTIITTDFEYDLDYAQSLENVEVISFRRVANLGFFLYTPEMKKWLRSNISKYDIVHLHNFRSYQNNSVCRYAQKYRIPYVLQPHGSLPRIIEKQGLKRIYDVVWGSWILKDASKIVAVSRTEAEQFQQAGIPDEKIAVIPNGFNVMSFTDLPPVGQFREQYGIREKHIILYVGRIHKLKGLDFLIRAFHSFVQSWAGDDVALVIVGPDDGYRSVLSDLVNRLGLSDRVRFVDYISPVGVAYRDADVLVYPSVYEIFGLVPFEALLCGTPVIVTDDCGCGELIEEAGCGYLVRYGDVAGLSETIWSALEHPDVNTKMVAAGRRYIEEHFAWERVVKQVEAMYEDCVRHV